MHHLQNHAQTFKRGASTAYESPEIKVHARAHTILCQIGQLLDGSTNTGAASRP